MAVTSEQAPMLLNEERQTERCDISSCFGGTFIFKRTDHL